MGKFSEETAASIFRVGKKKKRAAYFSNTCIHICQMFGFTTPKTIVALKQRGMFLHCSCLNRNKF
jgi:hypothetical protein